MKKALDEFIGVSPQTRIDIDGIVLRVRARRRRRRVVAACLGGLAVAAVATAVPLVLTGGHSAAPPAATTAPSVKPPAATATPAPTDDADRLFAALTAAIEREAPRVTGLEHLVRQVEQCFEGGYKFVPAKPGVTAIPCPAPPGEAARLDREYIWSGKLSTPKGTYRVRLLIYPTVHYDPSAPPVNAEDAEERRIAAEQGNAPTRGPNGESILVSNNLNLTKPDGTGILIQTSDVDETKPGSANRGPFTREQLTAIGLDPALHL